MSRNGTASSYPFGYSPAPHRFSDILETILDITGCRYGFLGALKFSDRGQGCIMTPRSVVMRTDISTQHLDQFEQSPVFPHSEDLFYRAIVARSIQVLKRPESILDRHGLLPEGDRLIEGKLVVVPTNADCTPRGLLGLVFPHETDAHAVLPKSRALVDRCGMLIEASALGFS